MEEVSAAGDAFIIQLLGDIGRKIEELPSVRQLTAQKPARGDNGENYSRAELTSAFGECLGATSEFDAASFWPKTRLGKSSEKSVEAREKGNLRLSQGDLSEALESYNDAVLFGDSEGGSEDVGVALANRAVVLQRIGRPKVALRGKAL